MKLFEKNWPVEEARATIILVHGTAEHSGRYEHVAACLNRHGYAVQSGDLPGWGQSPGRKGHIHSFEEYTDAVKRWLDGVESRVAAGHKIYVMGHSLGGLVAIRFIQCLAQQQEKLAGLILSSPCLQLKIQVPEWKKSLAQLLEKITPTLRMGNEIAPHYVTRDPQKRKEYIIDRLNYKKVSVRWFLELNKAMEEAWQKQQLLKLPMLVLQAGEDYLIDAEAVEQFVAGAPSTDKTFQGLPGLYHEVMNEPEREEVLAKLVRWLNDRTER